MHHIRTFIIDDSVTIRAMMSRVLSEDRDISIVGMAASAAEAEAMLAKTAVDVVTLDIEMPGVGGLDYLPTLVARSLPVVMLSGSTARGDTARTRALLSGAAGCFDKANAIRESKALIKLVKAAAMHKVRLDPTDAAAVAAAKG
ncbi:MAG: response regulator [Sphingomonas sp.]